MCIYKSTVIFAVDSYSPSIIPSDKCVKLLQNMPHAGSGDVMCPDLFVDSRTITISIVYLLP